MATDKQWFYGNVLRADITGSGDGANQEVGSLAQSFAGRGITYTEISPRATEGFTEEELRCFGYVGLTLSTAAEETEQ